MAKRVTIHIKKNDILYKITSIYLGSDGSFKLDVPYCDFTTASAFKFPADYTKRSRIVGSADFSQHFTSDTRPQLSIHASGFVQISGPNIKSGIDETTQQAKGLGIYTYPLNTPISSGPTCGVNVWGLEHFAKADTLKTSDIVLSDSDFIIKALRNKERMAEVKHLPYNFHILDFFVFPKEFVAGIRIDTLNREVITYQFKNYYECPGAIFTLPVIRLRNSDSFLGILPMLFKSNFPEKHSHGFIMGSPSGTNYPDKGEDLYHLQIVYPDIFTEETAKNGSLAFS